MDCDYCDGTINPTTKKCGTCGYDYTTLIESGEYTLADDDS
jgi:hypothetical protein